MKKLLLLFTICYLPIALFAQTSQTGSDYVAKRIQLLLSNAPQPVTNASVSVSGNPGPATYFYWIVTQTSIGASSPAGPFQVINAPNTLTGSNFNQISWATVPGATYDVLRTSNTGPPFGVCNCAVATAIAGNSVSDQSNTLSSYTVNTLDPSSLSVVLQNVNGSLSPGTPQTLPALTVTGFTSIKGPRPWVDVTAFGAKGDAATDDTTAIQQAINFACTGTTSAPTANLCPNAVSGNAVGGEVYIPAGDFHTSSPLLLYGGIRLVGAGKLATKITKTTNTVGTGSITAGTGVGRSPTACSGGACVDSFAVDSIISVPYISSGNTDYAYRWEVRDMALYGSGANGTKYIIYAPRAAQYHIINTYGFSNCPNGDPASCGAVQSIGLFTRDSWKVLIAGSDIDSVYRAWNWANDGSGLGAGTSTFFMDSGAFNVGCSGFSLFGLSYSAMAVPTVDHYNKASRDLANTDLTCVPYSFSSVNGYSISGGGAEDVVGGIMFVSASSVKVNGGFKSSGQAGYTSVGTLSTLFIDSSSSLGLDNTTFGAVTSPGNIFNIVLQNGSFLNDSLTVLPTGGNVFISYSSASAKCDFNSGILTCTNSTGSSSFDSNKYSFGETAAPSGAAGKSVVWADSTDHFLKYNPNNAGEQHLAQAVEITASYTNATTTFSTVTGMSWSIAAGKNYSVDCTFVGQGSATTAGPKFQLTGPASPTLVKLMVDGGTNATAYANAVATGFSSANTALGTLGAGTTDFIWHVNADVVNGATAGTLALQAAANGAGTLTISGGTCQIQ
jgi:hypothetical protein